jgi:hypothetical protein
VQSIAHKARVRACNPSCLSESDILSFISSEAGNPSSEIYMALDGNVITQIYFYYSTNKTAVKIVNEWAQADGGTFGAISNPQIRMWGEHVCISGTSYSSVAITVQVL